MLAKDDGAADAARAAIHLRTPAVPKANAHAPRTPQMLRGVHARERSDGDAGTGRWSGPSPSSARRRSHGMVDYAHAASTLRKLQFFTGASADPGAVERQ
jgi:hypothetical protein